ncbi:hypothetical protein NXT3_CH03747 [Sinorhizobium fredii]|uniref:Uncharacterized protein n=1 Tax=Rhizobium fredii TaxID=380 RepID=A0A2L0H9T9_RHIFR|nr:hypothetical protein NXT3_CH03747 [Sinorhizobium fredii]
MLSSYDFRLMWRSGADLPLTLTLARTRRDDGERDHDGRDRLAGRAIRGAQRLRRLDSCGKAGKSSGERGNEMRPNNSSIAALHVPAHAGQACAFSLASKTTAKTTTKTV